MTDGEHQQPLSAAMEAATGGGCGNLSLIRARRGRCGCRPSIRFLLRQLAGMGNNPTRSPGKLTAASGQALTGFRWYALMAIDAELERLHAVLEKGADDDVKFHPRGRGGGAGPVDYLLGKTASATGPSSCRESRRRSGSYRRSPTPKVHLRRPSLLEQDLPPGQRG